MALAKKYDSATVEPRLAERWEQSGVYRYDRDSSAPVFSIDTPPPTASGFLHLGHVYSYSHPDFVARYRRMRGDNVYYPMGYDDNGLPTERVVERRLGKTAEDLGRGAFIQKCLEMSEELERDYEALWRRLGLSIDWQYTYRTIDDLSRQTSQLSFLELFEKGLAYRRKAPTIWCPHCHTAIAQAEVNDLERTSEFVDLAFTLDNGATLPIATTRPELLPACVAIFVHPGDPRYRDLIGHLVTVPLFGHQVPLMEDEQADPEKGTGAVMCCTFGDQTDVEWWYTYDLPLREGIDPSGRLTPIAGQFAGMTTTAGRKAIVAALDEAGLLLARRPVAQSVRVHERCDTPVEYIITYQWFIRIIEHRDALLAAGEAARWFPAHMGTRYREWVSNVHWDWCISRQRFYGVAFPVWYCDQCGEVVVAGRDELPVDPLERGPATPCACGSTQFTPEGDVMDTWATSSMSPQIAGRMLSDPQLYAQVFPFSVRPQAHDIIRTWAFDTIVKSQYQFDTVPWRDVLISGWGLAAEGAGKISKSRGGGPMAPMEMLERYSSDAARYWAASAGPGKDAIISEEKIAAGSKLVTKLWNVARLSERFLEGYTSPAERPALSTADRWILSRLQRVVRGATDNFETYDYMAAKNEVETFFWRDLADNYLEMAKRRLYDEDNPGHAGARFTLHTVLLTVLKLLAPVLPYVTEEIYVGLFASPEQSIHHTAWPEVEPLLLDGSAEGAGEVLIEVATAVRRYKSDRSLSLGAELDRISLATTDDALANELRSGAEDLLSVTRGRQLEVVEVLDSSLDAVPTEGKVAVAVAQLPATVS